MTRLAGSAPGASGTPRPTLLLVGRGLRTRRVLFRQRGDVVAGDDRGADNAGDIRAHGVHEEKIGRIGFLSFDLRNACGHGDGADSGRADEWIDRIVAGEKIERFGREDAAGGAQSEGNDPEGDDEEGLRAEKTFPGNGDAHARAEENGNDIDDLILRGLSRRSVTPH